MKSKSTYNEEFIYDESAADRESSPVEPRFGAFLRSTIGTGKRVLDVGCGTGRYTKYTQDAGNSVTGLELVASAAEAGRRRGCTIVDGDCEAPFPFEDASFDAAQCIEVVEHLMDPVTTLAEIRRVLKPGGVLFLSTPNAAWWAHRVLLGCGVTSFCHSPTYPVEVNMHIRHFTMRTLTEFLGRSGFRVVRRQGTYTGFPSALAEYSPRWLAAVFRGLGRVLGGLGFLAKHTVWPSMTSAGLVVHAVREDGTAA